MSDTTITDVPDPVDAPPPHDHAWRRLKHGAHEYLVVEEYRCDLCLATWSS